MIKCETIELAVGEVVSREYKNISSINCATVSIMNIGNSDVLISNNSEFAEGNYITIPAGTAFNAWRFVAKTDIYFKSAEGGKVTVAVNEGW